MMGDVGKDLMPVPHWTEHDGRVRTSVRVKVCVGMQHVCGMGKKKHVCKISPELLSCQKQQMLPPSSYSSSLFLVR